MNNEQNEEKIIILVKNDLLKLVIGRTVMTKIKCISSTTVFFTRAHNITHVVADGKNIAVTQVRCIVHELANFMTRLKGF